MHVSYSIQKVFFKIRNMSSCSRYRQCDKNLNVKEIVEREKLSDINRQHNVQWKVQKNRNTKYKNQIAEYRKKKKAEIKTYKKIEKLNKSYESKVTEIKNKAKHGWCNFCCKDSNSQASQIQLFCNCIILEKMQTFNHL